MGVRTRSTSTILSPGGTSYLVGTANSQTFGAVVSTDTCTDTVDGTRNPHPLSVSHSHVLRWAVHGVSDYIRPYWIYNGYNSVQFGTSTPPTSSEPSNNASLSTLLARSNPNSPTLDLPLFLFELRDIPEMVHQNGLKAIRHYQKSSWGQKLLKLPKQVAKKNLEWQFGIAPILSDLEKMMNFHQSVEKTLNRLRNLSSRGATGGKATTWEDFAFSAMTSSPITPLYGEGNYVNYRWLTHRRKWGTCQWKSTVPVPPTSDADEVALAIRLTYGLNFSFHTIWNAMPWTWLIDWFSNVGDLASLSRNTVPVIHANACIMLEKYVKPVNITPRSGRGTYTLVIPESPQQHTLSRVVLGGASPVPEFYLPFLNDKQLSILASLAVTRT